MEWNLFHFLWGTYLPEGIKQGENEYYITGTWIYHSAHTFPLYLFKISHFKVWNSVQKFDEWSDIYPCVSENKYFSPVYSLRQFLHNWEK